MCRHCYWKIYDLLVYKVGKGPLKDWSDYCFVGSFMCAILWGCVQRCYWHVCLDLLHNVGLAKKYTYIQYKRRNFPARVEKYYFCLVYVKNKCTKYIYKYSKENDFFRQNNTLVHILKAYGFCHTAFCRIAAVFLRRLNKLFPLRVVTGPIL